MLRKGLIKRLLVHILIMGILLTPTGSAVSAEAVTEEENAITRAVDWLKHNQNVDGSWGNNETAFLDTSAVSEYLTKYEVIVDSLQQATSWMEGIQILNNDMAARVLPYIKDSEKHTLIKNSIVMSQNEDGGWGISKGYESDMLDTNIVLYSLITEENIDVSFLQKAVTYIINKQNTDGSWSFIGAEDGVVSLTAQTVITLNLFQANTNLISSELQTAMRKAGEYLVSIQNAEKTWGTDDSSIIGTLLSYRAVLNTISFDAVDTVKTAVLNVQSTDGSWYGSPYITALAIEAIKENMNMPFAEINSIKLFKSEDETRTECYSYNAYETFEIEVDCTYSTEDAKLLYFIKQKDGSVISAQTDGIPGWNTKNYLPGDYSVVVQIKDNSSGRIIASREIQFVINPSFKIEGVILSTDPENTRINNTCSVNTQATIVSNSNIDKALVLKTSVMDGKIVTKEEYQTIEFKSSDQIKTVIAITFTPEVSTSKDYTIKSEVFDGTSLLTQGETVFKVLPPPPPTRVDLSQSMTKPVLYPGQDSITAQFKLIGEGTPETPQRNPIDLILCIDDSGSMEWGNTDWTATKPWRIDFAKEASCHVIDLLQSNDRGAVVEFAGRVWTQQSITYDKNLLKGCYKIC